MLKPCKLGLSVGIVWGLSIFICTILASFTDYSKDFLMVLKSIYIGFDIGIGGAFIGLVYGLLDGFIGFAIIGWLYNKLSGCCCSKDHQ